MAAAVSVGTRHGGFSLVEVLVAMAIGTAAAGALVSLVVAGQSIARLQPEAADLQQRARIATHVLAFEGDSQAVWFEGNFSDYERDRKKRLGADADQPHRIKYKPLTR